MSIVEESLARNFNKIDTEIIKEALLRICNHCKTIGINTDSIREVGNPLIFRLEKMNKRLNNRIKERELKG